MKILFVIDSLYTSNNGTSISAQRYAGELRRRGHIVKVLCGSELITQEKYEELMGDLNEIYRVLTASIKTAKARLGIDNR